MFPYSFRLTIPTFIFCLTGLGEFLFNLFVNVLPTRKASLTQCLDYVPPVSMIIAPYLPLLEFLSVIRIAYFSLWIVESVKTGPVSLSLYFLCLVPVKVHFSAYAFRMPGKERK